MAPSTLPHVPPSSDDFTALVTEIATVESLPPRLASSEASEIEQSLIAFAAIWDAWVWSLGNTTAFGWL